MRPPLELFAAWRWVDSRCADPRCRFCNLTPAELAATRVWYALATDHGRRRLR